MKALYDPVEVPVSEFDVFTQDTEDPRFRVVVADSKKTPLYGHLRKRPSAGRSSVCSDMPMWT